MTDCRQFPSSGHLFFCRQLHVLLWAVLSSVSSVCWDEFKIRLLWLSMICLVLLKNIADFYGITVEYFSELVVSREVLVY